MKNFQPSFSRNSQLPAVIVREERGFTLIEMIGVLAVVAVLAALILPKVFDVIADSRVNAMAASVKAYETAVTKYYSDIGNVLPLNASGVPTAETTGDSATATSMAARLTLSRSDSLVTSNGLWPKFRGPYLEKFDTSTPPSLGTAMYLPATAAVNYGTATTATNLGWDLKGDDGNSDIPTGANVVYYRLTGLALEDFERLDSIIDRDIGTTTATKQLRGRAKYDTATSTLYLYLAHR
jgi:prepilin-type N-terminal cleavage/methylation domain-containing protein